MYQPIPLHIPIKSPLLDDDEYEYNNCNIYNGILLENIIIDRPKSYNNKFFHNNFYNDNDNNNNNMNDDIIINKCNKIKNKYGKGISTIRIKKTPFKKYILYLKNKYTNKFLKLYKINNNDNNIYNYIDIQHMRYNIIQLDKNKYMIYNLMHLVDFVEYK